MKDITFNNKCPKCKSGNIQEGVKTKNTLKPLIVNGINVHENKTTFTTEYFCFDCATFFKVRERKGERTRITYTKR